MTALDCEVRGIKSSKAPPEELGAASRAPGFRLALANHHKAGSLIHAARFFLGSRTTAIALTLVPQRACAWELWVLARGTSETTH